MSLRKKTISGVFWTLSQQFGIKAISFIVQIVLARILLPSEFGMIAMLSVFMSIGDALIDRGFTSSLIRTADADERDYSTVFYVNLVGSITIYFILFFSSPYIARFYNIELLSDVLRVYSLAFVVRAFAGVQITKLTKEMQFKKQMVIQIPSLAVGSIVGIVLALSGFGVWSLVWMTLSQSLLQTIQFWLRTDWYPSLVFDKRRFKSHFDFGYKLTIVGVINALYDNIYYIIIGKFFSVTQLGYYNRASSFQKLPVQSLSQALDKVTYPMFASIQDDNTKLKGTYKKVIQQVLFLVTPLMVISGAIAEPLFRFLLTEKWLPAVPYYQVLCVVGILYPIHFFNLNILKVKGRSDLVLTLNILKKITLTVGIAIALPFGIKGLLIMQVIHSTLSFVYNSYYSGKFIRYSIGEQVKDIFPVLLLSLFAGIIVWISDSFLEERASDLLRIIVGCVMGGVSYICTAYLFKSSPYIELRKIFIDKLGRRTSLFKN